VLLLLGISHIGVVYVNVIGIMSIMCVYYLNSNLTACFLLSSLVSWS